jgi:DNA invertase Pin-like site-specific DNA recombinase
MAERVPFVVAELGINVDLFVLHLYASLSQKERAMISSRTQETLQAVRRRLARQGRKLGNPHAKSLREAQRKGAVTTKATSDAFAASALPIIEGYAARGLTVREIAAALNKSGTTTLRGGSWHGSTVVKLQKRVIGLSLMS